MPAGRPDCGLMEGNTSLLVCDPIRPHRSDEHLFWGQGNLQPLRKECHDREKQRAEQQSMDARTDNHIPHSVRVRTKLRSIQNTMRAEARRALEAIARSGTELLLCSGGKHPLCLAWMRSYRARHGNRARRPCRATQGNPAKFWNAELWQPSCKWHHDLVKQILERAFARGKLKVADLWLSGAAAVRLTMAQLPMDASDR